MNPMILRRSFRTSRKQSASILMLLTSVLVAIEILFLLVAKYRMPTILVACVVVVVSLLQFHMHFKMQ